MLLHHRPGRRFLPLTCSGCALAAACVGMHDARAQGATTPPAGPGSGLHAEPSKPRPTGPFAAPERSGFDLDQRNILLIGTTTAAFAAYGRAKWWDQGFGGGFKTAGEGWFGRNTDNGGTDKLGHMFTTYTGTRLLASAFAAAGNGREASVRLAGWTTLGIFTGIEVVDGLSRNWRFSPEDALMNAAGVALGVLMENRPGLDEKIDLRFAYRKSSGSRFDPFGDYAGQRYLLVLKAEGFDALRSTPALRYLELGIGYQARFTPGGERRRDVYVGVSLNLSRLLADAAYGGQRASTPAQRVAETAFEYLQLPVGGYVRRSID